MNMTTTTFKRICQIVLFSGIVFFIILNYRAIGSIITFIGGILLPFVIGAVIAFIINIPMKAVEEKWFKKWKNRKFVRPLSLIVTIILVLLVISCVIMVVVPQLGTTASQLVQAMNTSLPQLQAYAENIFSGNKEIQAQIESLNINADSVISAVTDFLKSGVGNAFGSAFSAAKAALSMIASVAIGLVFACYILMQKENLYRQAQMLITALFSEKTRSKINYVAKKFSDTFSSFISCQCLEACILGSMFLVVLLLTRLPYAFLISILIAFTALIPVVGAFIGCAVGAFLILMESPEKALLFIVIFLILQQIEGNLIYPKVVGGSVGLPSMWVLFAVTVGSSLMGVAGMLFFIPLTSVIYSLIKEWTYKKLEDKSIEKDAEVNS